MGADLRLVAEVGVCCRQALPALSSQTGGCVCAGVVAGLRAAVLGAGARVSAVDKSIKAGVCYRNLASPGVGFLFV